MIRHRRARRVVAAVAVAVVAVADGPDPNFPSGTLLPGWGMNGVAGELLVSLSSGNPIALPTGGVWAGGLTPVQLPFPNSPSLHGSVFYAQGILFDPVGPIRFGLTEAVELLVGR